MEQHIYFDNAATTKPCSAAVNKSNEIITMHYGNPSSRHGLGTIAAQELEQSREVISEKLSCNKSELYFVGGGTESNNIAVIGGALAQKRRGNRVVISAIEHPSVMESAAYLESIGFEVVRVPPKNNQMQIDDIRDAINEKTVLVSVMMVNHETGEILPVSQLRDFLNGTPAKLHVDAVQAFGKIPVSVKNLGADFLSVSAHKIYGIKGAGALYIAKGQRVVSRQFGGEQELGIRPGTEPLPAIAAFGAAAAVLPDFDRQFDFITKLNQECVSGLLAAGAVINFNEYNYPFILNVSCPGIRSEVMLNHLSSKGIYVSSGSACSKGKKSRVLKAYGLPDTRIDSAVRISFSHNNTLEEVNILVKEMQTAMQSLKRYG